MKLTYFDARARAEPARLMLEMTGTAYEYEAISAEAWISGEAKARIAERTPFCQLPMLTDGAVSLCQSQAILRYLARKLSLYGDTIEEQARVDEVHETASELFIEAALFHWDPQFHERRDEHGAATAKKLELLSQYFTRVRADAEHWVLPGRYTMADVMMAFTLETLLPMHPGLVQGFPELHRFMTTFFTTGGVRDYVRSDRRPRTWTIYMATFAGKPEETHHWTD